MYKITHRLAPYLKSILVDSISRSDVYTYSFDESLNEMKESSEMELYFRFGMLTFSSRFLGHTRHLDLLTHFRGLTKDLNPSKRYQISMDGPNTNFKFFNEYSNKFA